MEELKEVFPGIEVENDVAASEESCESNCVGGTASNSKMKAIFE